MTSPSEHGHLCGCPRCSPTFLHSTLVDTIARWPSEERRVAFFEAYADAHGMERAQALHREVNERMRSLRHGEQGSLL